LYVRESVFKIVAESKIMFKVIYSSNRKYCENGSMTFRLAVNLGRAVVWNETIVESTTIDGYFLPVKVKLSVVPKLNLPAGNT